MGNLNRKVHVTCKQIYSQTHDLLYINPHQYGTLKQTNKCLKTCHFIVPLYSNDQRDITVK